MEGIPTTPTDKDEHMVSSWPSPYIPYLAQDNKVDPLEVLREGLITELKGWIELDQSWIGLLSRIKELTKDDPEIQALCSSTVSTEILMIRLEHEEIKSYAGK